MTKPQEIRIELFLESIIELHQKNMPNYDNPTDIDMIRTLGSRSRALQNLAVDALDILGEVWPEQEENN